MFHNGCTFLIEQKNYRRGVKRTACRVSHVVAGTVCKGGAFSSLCDIYVGYSLSRLFYCFVTGFYIKLTTIDCFIRVFSV